MSMDSKSTSALFEFRVRHDAVMTKALKPPFFNYTRFYPSMNRINSMRRLASIKGTSSLISLW